MRQKGALISRKKRIESKNTQQSYISEMTDCVFLALQRLLSGSVPSTQQQQPCDDSKSAA